MGDADVRQILVCIEMILSVALSQAFPPSEAANLRHFAAQRVKPAGEQLGRCLWCHWLLFLMSHAPRSAGGARRQCPAPIWIQHSPPSRSQHATINTITHMSACYAIRSYPTLRHPSSAWSASAPLRRQPASSRWLRAQFIPDLGPGGSPGCGSGPPATSRRGSPTGRAGGASEGQPPPRITRVRGPGWRPAGPRPKMATRRSISRRRNRPPFPDVSQHAMKAPGVWALVADWVGLDLSEFLLYHATRRAQLAHYPSRTDRSVEPCPRDRHIPTPPPWADGSRRRRERSTSVPLIR